MKLTVVIPAYNEEQAIASIIERSLAARDHIVANSPVEAVEVIVVSDGSTDGTVRIARQYDDIKLVVFERNRGYGAAIKRGFEEGSGDLVGFLDADGTCDPNFFADLCQAVVDENAAIAIGSRMGPDSEMPRTRRIGNRIYATILSVLTNRVVHDTASGMRVIRRDALQRLYPLPDGLHFTPAMSARALLDEHLPLVERPMTYRERVGESKLHVIRDGIRFFQTIMEMTLFWRPARVFFSFALLFGLITVLFAAHPIEMWLAERHLEESMIYRLLFCSFLGSLAVMCISALMISESLHALGRNPGRQDTLLHRALDEVFSVRGLAFVTLGLVLVIAVLIGPGVWTWIVERHVYIHWSRVVLAGMLATSLCQMYATQIVVSVIRLHASRNRFVEQAAARSAISTQAAIPTLSPSPAPADSEVCLT